MAGLLNFTWILALSIFALSLSAQAESVTDWGDVGRWKIRVDEDAGNGCFMETTVEDGTMIRFGYVPNRNGGFFAIYNSAWTDIVAGEKAKVTLEFDAKQFTGDAENDARGGMPGGYAFFNNPNVRDEFSRSRTMIIFDENGHRIEVDLSGTSKAVQSVEACQKKQAE